MVLSAVIVAFVFPFPGSLRAAENSRRPHRGESKGGCDLRAPDENGDSFCSHGKRSGYADARH